MSNIVLTYNMKDDLFIVYKNGKVFICLEGEDKWFSSIRAYEAHTNVLLEDLYPSGIVLMAKQRLGWELYEAGGFFYELLPNKKCYKLEKDKTLEVKSKPTNAKKVSWIKHPYKLNL